MPIGKTYENIYPKQWNAIKQAAANYGIRIETAIGEGGAFGVTLKWNWKYQAAVAATPTLCIDILGAGLMTQTEAMQFVDDIITNAIS